MTPKPAWRVAILQRPWKTDARCGWLLAARAARTMVEGLIWLFSLASGRLPPVDCACTRDHQTLHDYADGGCGRSSALSCSKSWKNCRGTSGCAIVKTTY